MDLVLRQAGLASHGSRPWGKGMISGHTRPDHFALFNQYMTLKAAL
jgi:hypothetical protein